MSQQPLDAETTRTLARAFDRAWDRYYRSGRTTLDPAVARPVLAKRLVQLAKAGERDEGRLAAGGLTHLHTYSYKPRDRE